jgi:radical SAM superfamily enzyme YgiQ (UPF0313 family)
LSRPLRILLIKPYQPATQLCCQPPLGLLYLVSSLRDRFKSEVDVRCWDLRLFREGPEEFAAKIAGDYDILGISALNCEADASYRLARAVKAASPGTVTVLGGPLSRSAPDQVMESGAIDWIFGGEAERTFPRAIEKRFFGDRDLAGIPGLAWRAEGEAAFRSNGGEDYIQDLDSIAMPAWDLVPFDIYARRSNMNNVLKEERYAPLFTSRGCPYTCHYCHDIFGKGFRWRSVDGVLGEIETLTERYGVREFQIVDDIYNLHKPRMRSIAKKVIERYGPRSLHFCFPNGVRADIIDPADLPLLREMGVYSMSVAVETVSPRLQKLIDKNLDIQRASRVIDAADASGIAVRGFFMLGFPTETREEIDETVRFALRSRLTFATFFSVIPQKGTPIYELARRESASALETVFMTDYYSDVPWYQLAYGLDLLRIRRKAMRRFYLTPTRVLRLLRLATPRWLALGVWHLLSLILPKGASWAPRVEELLQPLLRRLENQAGWDRIGVNIETPKRLAYSTGTPRQQAS